MARRSVVALATASLAAAAAAVLVSAPAPSAAVLTSTSRSTATVRAAADWTPPTVSLSALPDLVTGTVEVAAVAADAEAGIAQVAIDRQAADGTWTRLCVDTTAPYSCSWDTTRVADGRHALRAVATDGSGLDTTSATATATVANALAVALAAPPQDIRGTVPLTATLHGATGGFAVRFQYGDATAGTWTTACTDSAAPYTCSWVTTGVDDGDYDLRAVAVSGAVTVTSPVVSDVEVDNTAPTVTLANPGSPLRGTVALTADADDTGSGVDTVVLQYAATGTSTWRDLCTAGDEPYSCAVATTQLPDGSYSFRAVATDAAGNTTTSAAVAQRVVDNTVASVSLDDPGGYLRGAVTLSASANSSAGVASVRIQRAAAGTTTWVDVCADTTAPYTCTWATTTVANGSYDLRAVMVDTAGRSTTSAVLGARRVDNSALRAADVQVTNGGTTGKVDAGDVVTYTFSQEVSPASISSGWTGAPLAVTTRLRDGWLVGTSSGNDVLDVVGRAAPVNLGFVTLRQNHLSSLRTALLDGVLTTRTVQVDGVPVTQVTLTVGRLTSGKVRSVSRAVAMAWYPSTAVTDRSGASCSAFPVTESGANDRDF